MGYFLDLVDIDLKPGGAGYSESGTYALSTLQGWYPLGSILAEYPKGTQTTFYQKKARENKNNAYICMNNVDFTLLHKFFPEFF